MKHEIHYISKERGEWVIISPEDPWVVDDECKLGAAKRRTPLFFKTKHLVNERCRMYRGCIIVTGKKMQTEGGAKAVLAYAYDGNRGDMFHIGKPGSIKSVAKAKELIDCVLKCRRMWYSMEPGQLEPEGENATD